jgi:hypothetical protein
MTFTILDYCDFYYKNIAKTALPPVRSGKFAQISSMEDEYLILSPKLFSEYHADIVERFCELHEIDGHYDKVRYVFKIHYNKWKVKGGGRWLMDDNVRVLNLFDDSKAYGRFDSKGMIEKIMTDMRFNGYVINIDKI